MTAPPNTWPMNSPIKPLRLAKGPGDALSRECAELLLKPSPTHVRLAADLQRVSGSGGQGDADPLALLTRAFALVDAVQPIRDRLRQSGVRDWREAHRHRRRLTNIGTFRAYGLAYLKQNPEVRQDMAMMVRMMEPTADGIPVEVYCFTAVTAWVEYERIQGDIFDHLLAILPELGLRLYQQLSTGNSLAVIAKVLQGLGTLQSAGDLSFRYTGSLNQEGDIVSGRDLTLSVGGAMDNRAKVSAVGDLSITADSLNNQAPGELLAHDWRLPQDSPDRSATRSCFSGQGRVRSGAPGWRAWPSPVPIISARTP